MVERSVEAGHLRHAGESTKEGVDQCDFPRQVARVQGADTLQFLDQRRGDALGSGIVRAAVDDPVADSLHRFEIGVLPEPVD